MTRRLLGLAAAAVAAGAALLPVQSASACRPNEFPHCTTPCKALVYRYYEEIPATYLGVNPPNVPSTGLAGCP